MVELVVKRLARSLLFVVRQEERTSYRSFLCFTDPDGNTWLVQEVTTRLWSAPAPRPDERR